MKKKNTTERSYHDKIQLTFGDVNKIYFMSKLLSKGERDYKNNQHKQNNTCICHRSQKTYR